MPGMLSLLGWRARLKMNPTVFKKEEFSLLIPPPGPQQGFLEQTLKSLVKHAPLKSLSPLVPALEDSRIDQCGFLDSVMDGVTSRESQLSPQQNKINKCA